MKACLLLARSTLSWRSTCSRRGALVALARCAPQSVLSGRAATSAPFVCALLIAVRAPGADRTLHMAVSALCLRRGTGAEHAARRLNEGEGPPERYAGCCRAPASPAATRTGRPPPRCCRSMLIIQKRLMHATRRQVQGMPRGAYARPRVIWARHRLLRCASRGHAARMRPAPPAAPASLERSENFFYSNRVCFLGPNPQRDPILSFLFSGDPILAIPRALATSRARAVQVRVKQSRQRTTNA